MTNSTSTDTDGNARIDVACCGDAVEWIDADTAAALARRVSALADPVRLQILSIIANSPSGEVCACDFVGPLERAQPTVSHHLKVLAEAGLVDGDKRGRWVWYRATVGGTTSVADRLRRLADGEC